VRYFEVTSGIRVRISREEQSVLNAIREQEGIAVEELGEREGEIARLLVSRGVLRRVVHNDAEQYVCNSDPNLRRI
jgi:hypothetical protein